MKRGLGVGFGHALHIGYGVGNGHGDGDGVAGFRLRARFRAHGQHGARGLVRLLLGVGDRREPFGLQSLGGLFARGAHDGRHDARYGHEERHGAALFRAMPLLGIA